MRRIRANTIAILTVAWILGTFYYLWQDNKPQSTSSASQSRGKGHGQKVSPGRLEIHRDDRTIPLIVSERRLHVDVRALKVMRPMAEVLVMVHSWEYVVLTGTVTPPPPLIH